MYYFSSMDTPLGQSSKAVLLQQLLMFAKLLTAASLQTASLVLTGPATWAVLVKRDHVRLKTVFLTWPVKPRRSPSCGVSRILAVLAICVFVSNVASQQEGHWFNPGALWGICMFLAKCFCKIYRQVQFADEQNKAKFNFARILMGLNS